MKTIHKYRVPWVGQVEVEMPVGARPLTVQMQDSQITMWALVDAQMPLGVAKVYVAGTGFLLPDATFSDDYVGTVQATDDLVLHVFCVPPTRDDGQPEWRG